MKYKRLMAEMLVKGITKDDLGELLGKSRSTINTRFSGKSDFTLSEALKIMHSYFEDYSSDYIFSMGEYKEQESIGQY
ncbi:helix-turn-helix domain-containing protein [Clostridium algidicarnis]|uniref:helix-turn-helix domain-containing protein n=1 Tax=Clostridium algidicarnis TaxID=37659 RepID=UPI003FD8C63E